MSSEMDSLVIDYRDITCPLCQLEHRVDYGYPKDAEEKGRFDFSYVCPRYQETLFVKIVYRIAGTEQIAPDPYAQYFPYPESREIKGKVMSNEDDAMNDAAKASDTLGAEFGGIVWWIFGGAVTLLCFCGAGALLVAAEAGWFLP